MATSSHLFRSPSSRPVKTLISHHLRFFSTDPVSSSTKPSRHNHHQRNHEFLPPNNYISSWKHPKTPEEAEAQLTQLRRDYAKNVRSMRKEYVAEMEFNKLEKERRDKARQEELRITNEERKVAKAAQKKVEKAEREAAEKEFRQTLLKEREQKLDYWRMREGLVVEKKKEKNELLRRQSSMWIDESELEKKILEAIVDTTPL